MRPVDNSNAGSPDLTGKPAEIQTQQDGDSVTITVHGEIDLSTADDLDAAIRDAEDTEIGQIVVDLSDLAFLDSSGLSVLLKASVRNREDTTSCFDGTKLIRLPTRLIALTGTGEIFD